MSFRVHAAGTDGFRYTRDNNADEDIFVAADVMAAIRASGPSRIGVAEGVADYALPSPDGMTRDAYRSVARTAFMHSLRTSVNLLAANGQARQGGFIAVMCRQTRAFGMWPDTASHVLYMFNGAPDAASDFVRTITPALEATGMNNYGILRVLSMVLADYHAQIGFMARPMIQFEFTK